MSSQQSCFKSCQFWFALKTIGILFAILLFSLILFLVPLLTPLVTIRDTWNIPEIEQYIGVSLPQNSNNILYDGNKGRSAWLTLSFESPVENMKIFYDHFCNGIYYSGYDPFNAIDTAQKTEFTHPINVGLRPYFSYSTNLPQNIKGNRCYLLNQSGAIAQIRIDASDPKRNIFQMRLFFSCEVCELPKD